MGAHAPPPSDATSSSATARRSTRPGRRAPPATSPPSSRATRAAAATPSLAPARAFTRRPLPHRRRHPHLPRAPPRSSATWPSSTAFAPSSSATWSPARTSKRLPLRPRVPPGPSRRTVLRRRVLLHQQRRRARARADQILLDVTRVAVLDVDYHAGTAPPPSSGTTRTCSSRASTRIPTEITRGTACYADDVGGGEDRARRSAFPCRDAGVERVRPRARHRAQGDRATRRADTHRVPRTGHPRGRSRAGEGHRGHGTRPRRLPRDGTDDRRRGRATVFVQEGGYQVEAAGDIVAAVFLGMEEGFVLRNPERGDPADVIEMQVRGELEARRAAEARAKAKRATAASSGETGTGTETETETDEGEGGAGTRGRPRPLRGLQGRRGGR